MPEAKEGLRRVWRMFRRHDLVAGFSVARIRVKGYYTSKWTAKYYSLRTSCSFYGSWLPLPSVVKATITNMFVEKFEESVEGRFIGSLVAPTVKFHLNPDRVVINPIRTFLTSSQDKFVLARDGLNSNIGQAFEGALVTKHQFAVLDIGILGGLKNGLNAGVFKRIYENKAQFLLGVTQLTCVVALIVLIHPALIAGSPALMGIAHWIQVLNASSPLAHGVLYTLRGFSYGMVACEI